MSMMSRRLVLLVLVVLGSLPMVLSGPVVMLGCFGVMLGRWMLVCHQRLLLFGLGGIRQPPATKALRFQAGSTKSRCFPNLMSSLFPTAPAQRNVAQFLLIGIGQASRLRPSHTTARNGSVYGGSRSYTDALRSKRG